MPVLWYADGMRLTYQYRLRPTTLQLTRMEAWLELLRRRYNYRLAERLAWWEQSRCDIGQCSLENCHLPELKEQPGFYTQKRDLLKTKALFPEFQDIHSQVLQNCIERVQLAFERWLKGDGKGKRSGRPRFTGKGRYRSFTFPQLKLDCIEGKLIKLPSFGWVKFINHRPIPDGFKLKTATPGNVILDRQRYLIVQSESTRPG